MPLYLLPDSLRTLRQISILIVLLVLFPASLASQQLASLIDEPLNRTQLAEVIQDRLEAGEEPLSPQQAAALESFLEENLEETPTHVSAIILDGELRKGTREILTPEQVNILQRGEAGRLLLSDGVGGLRAVLSAANAPALTFDQETQVNDVHTDHQRVLAELLMAHDGDETGFDEEVQALEDQLLLAALKFLNPAQRTALTGSVSGADFSSLNSDLPEDPDELREYLTNLRSPASGGGGGGGGGNFNGGNFNGGGGGGGNFNGGNFNGGNGGGLSINGFGGNGRMPDRDEILEIRINENSFTAESSNQSRGQTQIITRGGTGRFNGDARINFADESLDARNAFASFRPPYQQRDMNLNLSGPVIRNRLTMTFGLSRDMAEEGGNLYAITPNGLIDDAIVRPGRNRNYNLRSTAQLSHNHVLNLGFSTGRQENDLNNVGQLNLEEQGSRNSRENASIQLRETAVLSGRLNNEFSFSTNRFTQENRRLTDAPNLNVLGAFRGGGNTNDNINRVRNMEFGNLLMYTGDRVSLRMGYNGSTQRLRSENRNSFNGAFTFAGLFDYCGATNFEGPQCQIELQENPGLTPQPALRYVVNSGDPFQEVNVFSSAGFLQSDWRVRSGLTLSLGLRYEWQTNLDDYNNLAPRLGFAYSLGGGTVLRGGTGIFYQRLDMGRLNNLTRLDGMHQLSYVVTNPTYPDPFAGGAQADLSNVEIRRRDEALAAPYTWNSELTLERNFENGLVVTGTYRFIRGVHLFRSRNINAPYDSTSTVIRSCQPGQDPATCVRPDPSRGNINLFESTGLSSSHNFRVGFRKQLRFLNLNGNYNFDSTYTDVSDDFELPADNYDLASEWGRDGGRHNFDASVNIRFPWNFNADTSFNWNTGEPYSLTTGRDDNQDTNVDDRPPGVPRNSLTGPGFFEMNLNLSKSVQLRSAGVANGPVASGGYYGQRTGVRMTISASINNLLNKVNFQSYSGVQTSPFFGLATRARSARSIRLSLRFNF